MNETEINVVFVFFVFWVVVVVGFLLLFCFILFWGALILCLNTEEQSTLLKDATPHLKDTL